MLHYVARAALRDLTRRVDARGVFSHPSERALTVHLFVLLRRAKVPFKPAEVREWLMRNGWSSRQADKVGVVAGQVASGRIPKGWKPVWWSSKVMETWEREIALR